MPELPEVETIARGLARHIEGQVISTIRLHRRDIMHGNTRPIDKLVGRRVGEVRRCGKLVRITWADGDDADCEMYVHLGMTGRLLVVDRDEPLEKHTHLQIEFEDSPGHWRASRQWHNELRFCDPRRFGGIWLVTGVSICSPRTRKDRREQNLAGEKIGGAEPRRSRWVGRRLPPIGADPLEISLPELRALLARKRRIKPLLMDQVPISGMGNIYCDEALFRAGIHPLTPAGDLDGEAVRRLHSAIRRVLTEAIKAGGSSISDYRDADNVRGSFQERHRVYGREGGPCPGCGTSIERLVVAGRGTHVCPKCQPLPS